MAKTKFMTNFSRSLHRTGLKLRKYSPEIFIVVGVVGTVTSAVMACKATTKLNPILDEAKTKIDTVHKAMEKKQTDGKKELTTVYTHTGLELAKLYAPSVALGVLSLGAIIASNNILRGRYVASVAAYTAVDKSFKKYRNNVVERFGKELDREFKFGVRTKEVEEREVDENGNEKIVKKTVEVPAQIEHDEYSRVFDEWNPFWEKSAEYNLTFLMQQQRAANKILEEQGYLFLNDVYKMLGFDQTKAGQEIGWVYDKNDPSFENHVDFGIHDLYNEQKCDFVNGRERSIILDFNPDGNVMYILP